MLDKIMAFRELNIFHIFIVCGTLLELDVDHIFLWNKLWIRLRKRRKVDPEGNTRISK